MAQRPPVRSLPCPAARANVPVPVLVWEEYAPKHFRAEPLPGYRFHVVPDPSCGGWIFYLPGKPPTPCTKRGIATHACEHYWFEAMGGLLAHQAPARHACA